MNSKEKILLLITLGVFIVVLVIGFSSFKNNEENLQGGLDGNNNALSAIDYSDNKKLMGGSHNVFVARITRYLGDTNRGIGPESQYEAEIVYNIKGELADKVIVNATGGEVGEKITLNSGSTYVLATRYSAQYDWYTVNSHPSVTKLIRSDSTLTIDDLKKISLKDERVHELLTAYVNEELLASDRYHNNTLNSFASLSDEEKELVYDKFSKLSPEQPVPIYTPREYPVFDGEDDFQPTYREENTRTLCRDNLDEDLDGLVDAADPDCAEFYTASTPKPDQEQPQPVFIPPPLPSTSTVATSS